MNPRLLVVLSFAACTQQSAPRPIATPHGHTASSIVAARALTNYASRALVGRSLIITSDSGQQLRLTPYGDAMLRVQAAPVGAAFVADDRYEMVARHDFAGAFTVTEDDTCLRVQPTSGQGVAVEITKRPLHLTYVRADTGAPIVAQAAGIVTGDRPLAILAGTAAAALAFPPSGGWATWTHVSYRATLAAGDNVVRLTTAGANGPNVDSLRVVETQQLLEAEQATLASATTSTDNAGFTGSGYARFLLDSGASMAWTVSVPAAGDYTLDFRYANGDGPAEHLAMAPGEHFLGLGHGPFGRVSRLDLAGQVIARNRGWEATLVVPFYLSSAGYGVFVNNTYANRFSFMASDYSFALGGGQLDYFVIAGPELPTILDHYTELTGRPHLPPLAAFGLGMSDKEAVVLPSSASWWQDQVTRMRAGGWPIDILIQDNSWRGGKTAAWQWDRTRYPDPAAYETWCQQSGVFNLLDFNRADDTLSVGWQPSFAMPGTTDWPDFTSETVRDWFWNLLFTQTLDPALHYPGDFLWLDEPDEDVAPQGPLANGRTWDEVANEYFLLLAKAVGEGWEAGIGARKRPFVMTRGMTAGGQRWSTLWSGDIDSTYAEMALEVRGMLAAGLSGFPFWAHDAGGFNSVPSDAMYRQWAMAFGSFTPIWKPHGPGLRFPWLFSADAQGDARRFGALRMSLLPYIYTTAHTAATTGLPMARALPLAYAAEPDAWTHDLEYLWGDELLVIPNISDGNDNVPVWLPPGRWYDFSNDFPATGPASFDYFAPTGVLPTYVKAGAIVPGALPGLGTQFWDKTVLVIDVYTGADGSFALFDDDGSSEGFAAGAAMTTSIGYRDAQVELSIGAAVGTYAGAPVARSYQVRLHGLAQPIAMTRDGAPIPTAASPAAAAQANGAYWDAAHKVLTVYTQKLPVTTGAVIARASTSGLQH
jgi:alpha-D-xyloside xylohydrolase